MILVSYYPCNGIGDKVVYSPWFGSVFFFSWRWDFVLGIEDRIKYRSLSCLISAWFGLDF